MDDLTPCPETRVAIAGDWHSNFRWVDTILPALREWAPEVRTVLHLGDFGIWDDHEQPDGFVDRVDRMARLCGIERILVTPGNHEHWGILGARFAAEPGQPARLGERVWALPRGHRMTIGGRTILSFGGAASIDHERLSGGVSWWPNEVASPAEAAAAREGGTADIMLTHEAISHVGPRAALHLVPNPNGWSAGAIARAAASRALTTSVWETVHPHVLAHGHLHVDDENTLPDGRRVYSVDRDGSPRNLALLDLRDLSWTWFD